MSQMGDWIDHILAAGVQDYVEKNKTHLTSPASLKSARKDLAKLGEGEDPFYDIPGIGAAYAMTYHATRMNTVTSSLFVAVKERLGDQQDPPSISLIDLGCGTGVGLWALTSLLEAARRGWIGELEDIGMPKRIHYLGLDSSPFMIDAAKELWEKCGGRLSPEIPVVPTFRMCNWPIAPSVVPRGPGFETPWMMASFLFDFDMANEEPGTGDLRKSFLEVSEYFHPDFIFLLCTSKKQKCTKQIVSDLEKLRLKNARGRYVAQAVKRTELLTGTLGKTSIMKKCHLGDPYNLSWIHPYPKHTYILQWNGERLISQQLAMQSIKLDTRQKTAADLTTLMAVGGSPRRIKGPPGSGKTLILYQLLVEYLSRPIKNSAALFVCFNKALINQVFEWHSNVQIFKENKLPNCEWRAIDDRRIEIWQEGAIVARLLSFDKLPTQIGRLPPKVGDGFEEELRQKFSEAPEHLKDFTLERLRSEFRVHFYGKAQMNLEKYLEIERNPRTGLRLARGTKIREEIGKLFQDISDPYLANRILLLQKIKNGMIQKQFDFVLIDELQDMTDTDFEIIRGLSKSGCILVAAEDARQSIQTGLFYRAPLLHGGKKWNDIKISTCYRTPYRVGPILQQLEDQLESNPRDENEEFEEHVKAINTRLSFTGIRPIFVEGGTALSVAHIIREIAKNLPVYHAGALARGLILETNYELQNACQKVMKDLAIRWETRTILGAKGLESQVLVWDTGSKLPVGRNIFNLAYTILSRTTCLCIIWQRPESKRRARDLFSKMTDLEMQKWPNPA